MFFEFSEYLKNFSDFSYLYNADISIKVAFLSKTDSKEWFYTFYPQLKRILIKKSKLCFFEFSDIRNISLLFVFFFADFFLKIRKLPFLALKMIKLVKFYKLSCYSNKNSYLGKNCNFLEAFCRGFGWI